MTTFSDNKVRVINSITGGAANVPRWYFEHPVFGKNLVEVKDGQKSYTPELYISQTVEEFAAAHPDKLAEPDETNVED